MGHRADRGAQGKSLSQGGSGGDPAFPKGDGVGFLATLCPSLRNLSFQPKPSPRTTGDSLWPFDPRPRLLRGGSLRFHAIRLVLARTGGQALPVLGPGAGWGSGDLPIVGAQTNQVARIRWDRPFVGHRGRAGTLGRGSFGASAARLPRRQGIAILRPETLRKWRYDRGPRGGERCWPRRLPGGSCDDDVPTQKKTAQHGPRACPSPAGGSKPGLYMDRGSASEDLAVFDPLDVRP